MLLSIFTHFHPLFCSFQPHPLLSRLISPHFGDPEKAVVHTVVSLGAKSRIVIIKVARRARAGQTPSHCGAPEWYIKTKLLVVVTKTLHFSLQ